MAGQLTRSNQLQVSSSFDTFYTFPSLPAELRLKIWNMAYETRRIAIRNRSNRPPLDPYTSRFLLVNHEARHEFQTRYIKYFNHLGNRPVFVNPAVDTLRFNATMHGLQKYIRHYPTSLSSLRYLEVHPRSGIAWKQLDLGCFTSLKTITVSAYYTEPTPRGTQDDSYTTATTLTALKTIIKASPMAIELNAVFHRRTHKYRYSIYFRSTNDLSYASYGRILGEAFPDNGQLQIKWLKIDKPWIAYSKDEDKDESEVKFDWDPVFNELFLEQRQVEDDEEHLNTFRSDRHRVANLSQPTWNDFMHLGDTWNTTIYGMPDTWGAICATAIHLTNAFCAPYTGISSLFAEYPLDPMEMAIEPPLWYHLDRPY